MREKTPYSKRFEDYLEAIYRLQKSGKTVRIRDLAKVLGVKPPSVVEYLKNLAQQGLIVYEKREHIKLTPKGEEIARKVLDKHKALQRFLKEVLMVPDNIAEEDACYMEHGLHEITLNRIKEFLEFIDRHYKVKSEMTFLERLRYFYEHKRLPEEHVS